MSAVQTIVYVISLASIIASLIGSIDGQTVTRTMFVNALLDEYDNAATPTFDKSYPTQVNVSLHVQGINSVNEQSMDFSVNLYVTQSWTDERLSFQGLIDADMLELDSKIISKFWVPDLYFVNEKSSNFHTVTVPNRLLHLYQDGTVVYKIRITLTAACEMALQNFPMDAQNCTLYMKSFGYTNNSLQLEWDSTSPLTYTRNLKMSQFSLVGLRHRECHDVLEPIDNETNVSTVETQSVFTCLAVDFLLHRSVGFYTIQIYIPSTLIVVLSWVSFVLDVTAVPARISLGILTVLTMTNMKTIAVSSLPKVSYIKAIDIWMAVCLSFVFASLLEFAIVNAFARRVVLIDRSTFIEAQPLNGSEPQKVAPDSPSLKTVTCPNGLQRAKQIDLISLFLFPVCFLLFVSVYLFVYVA